MTTRDPRRDIIQPKVLFIGPVGSKLTWSPCQYPERPPDENVGYHTIPKCHACDVARQAFGFGLFGRSA